VELGPLFLNPGELAQYKVLIDEELFLLFHSGNLLLSI
jgi:hypothetical protein